MFYVSLIVVATQYIDDADFRNKNNLVGLHYVKHNLGILFLKQSIINIENK